jgi:hypothetical protein
MNTYQVKHKTKEGQYDGGKKEQDVEHIKNKRWQGKRKKKWRHEGGDTRNKCTRKTWRYRRNAEK